MFSGCGLLDAGLERAGFDVIWHAETDAAASRVLEAHWPGVPNLGDVAAVDWEQVERPDVLCGGGWPCQPFSPAGAQKGETDDRYLWPEVTRALRVLRPRHFVMEQSSAILARKFRPIWLTVLADLAEVGFDAEWAVVRASDVGAPHRRERLFLVAHANGAPGRQVPRGSPGHEGPHESDGTDLARSGGQTAAHAQRCDRDRRQAAQGGVDLRDRHEADRDEGAGEPAGRDQPAPDAIDRGPGPRRPEPNGGGFADCGGRLAADPDLPGRSGEQGAPAGRDGLLGAVGDDPDGRRLARWGQYTAAIARWEAVTGELAPDPLDTRGRLNVELSRWMMGAAPGWHGGESRIAALRMYGNGVVTQVAEAVGGWLKEGIPS